MRKHGRPDSLEGISLRPSSTRSSEGNIGDSIIFLAKKAARRASVKRSLEELRLMKNNSEGGHGGEHDIEHNSPNGREVTSLDDLITFENINVSEGLRGSNEKRSPRVLETIMSNSNIELESLGGSRTSAESNALAGYENDSFRRASKVNTAVRSRDITTDSAFFGKVSVSE